MDVINGVWCATFLVAILMKVDTGNSEIVQHYIINRCKQKCLEKSRNDPE